MIEQLVLPTPRRVETTGSDSVSLGRELSGDAAALGPTFDLVRGKLARYGQTGGQNVSVRLGDGAAQSYVLATSKRGIELTVHDVLGLRYGIDTLLQLSRTRDATVPVVHIEDEPWMSTRGIYIESTRGVEQLSIDDWELIFEQLATYRINRVALALYGCWDIHHAERSEVLMVRLSSFPALATSFDVTFYEPREGREVTRCLMPRLTEPGALGSVVAGARRHGIEPMLWFGGPGHNTLIPRHYPEVSAKDEDGLPKGYGYCVTSPSARGFLKELYTSLVQEHLRPHDITSLGCGGDEYYALRNIDPPDPLRQIEPWCRCRSCASLSPGEQLLAFYRHIGEVIEEAGVDMVVWHDSLVREGVLERFAAWARSRRRRPTVAWWKYGDPLPKVARHGLGTWVSPTVGLIPALFMEDLSSNIEAWMLAAAESEEIEGVMAYNIVDPIFHANYAVLGQLAWNPDVDRITAIQTWIARVWPDAPRPAAHALDRAWRTLGNHALVTYVLDHLLGYFSTAPHGVRDHPVDVLRGFSVPTPDLVRWLSSTSETLRAAAEDLPPSTSVDPWPDVASTFKAEWTRTADQIELIVFAINLLRGSRDLEQGIIALHELGQSLMGRAAEHRLEAHRPYILREHWSVLRGLESAVRKLSQLDTRNGEVYEAWRFT